MEPTSTQQRASVQQASTTKEKWVKNLSDRPLTSTEISVLSKGANFAIAPRHVPLEDFVIATEDACRRLSHRGEAAALRAEVTEILQEAKAPPSNLTRDEQAALITLKKDESVVIVPADKGKCIVVMNRTEYIEKMETKLSDTTTYKRIVLDPTQEIKDALSNQLKEIHDQGQLYDNTYIQETTTYPIPRMHGHPKIHKADYPLREIVDGTGGVVKQVDKFLSQIIKQYVKDTDYYVKNSTDFVEKVKDETVADDEVLVSYDVTALYPSVPQDEAIEIVS